MKKNHALLFILFILINVSCKTNKKNELIKFSGLAQGTTYSISYYDKEGRNFQKEIDSILKKFDLSVSIYDSTSIISKINKATEPQKVDFYFEEIFKLS
ncbi:MAG TPA: FAD:protein FMN transferase, partial [Bacteroidales bacterium]|nr:FAD:protein FMN transferase [Bacteroidales bacterium]